MANTLTGRALTEEVEFFRHICGWDDKRIEAYLELADGTLGQRRRRAVKRERTAKAA